MSETTQFPPWNTENYGFDFGDGLPENTKEMPKIYGLKTPEKHKFVFTDGVPEPPKKGEVISKPGSMGLGKLGITNTTFRRKWRWSVSGQFGDLNLSEKIIKTQRPQIDSESGLVEDKTFKTHFDEAPKDLIDIVTTFMWQHPDDQLTREGIERWNNKLGTLKLTLYDGTATVMETWAFEGVHVKSVEFGELDYSSSEEPIIDVVWGFKKCTWETPAYFSPISGTTKKSSKCLTGTPTYVCTTREMNTITRTI